MEGLPEGLSRSDGRPRCAWCAVDGLYRAYHDREWGRPCADDRALFEKLCLEGFQAGLSWHLILRRRQALREAFDGFDFRRLARRGEERVRELLEWPGMIRHRAKIEAVLENARVAERIACEEGSLAAFLWRFEPAPENRPARFDWQTLRRLTSCPEAEELAGELRRRGWRFIGPTTAYAFMQAMGFVNDHVEGCFRRPEIEAERGRFVRPTAA